MNSFKPSRSKKELSNFRFAGALESESVYVVEALKPRILLSAAPMAAPVEARMEAESVCQSSSSEQQQHAALVHAAEFLQLTQSDEELAYFYGEQGDLLELSEPVADADADAGTDAAASETVDEADVDLKLNAPALEASESPLDSVNVGNAFLSAIGEQRWNTNFIGGPL